MSNSASCTYQAFHHCEPSNDFSDYQALSLSKCFGCICRVSHRCGFSCVLSDLLPVNMNNRIGCICRVLTAVNHQIHVHVTLFGCWEIALVVFFSPCQAMLCGVVPCYPVPCLTFQCCSMFAIAMLRFLICCASPNYALHFDAVLWYAVLSMLSRWNSIPFCAILNHVTLCKGRLLHCHQDAISCS